MMATSWAPALFNPRNVRSLLSESAATVRYAARYLPGESRSISDRMVAARRAPSRACTLPVLLVHGLTSNQSWAWTIGRFLAEHGYQVRTVNYRTVGVDIDTAARSVAAAIAGLSASTVHGRVHVVAHSLGGITTRAAAVDHGMNGHLAGVVSLGSPHQGTSASAALTRRVPRIGHLVSQLAPGSPYLRALDAGARSSDALSWTAIYSPVDELVPGEYGKLTVPAYAAINIALPALGHLALTGAPQVLARTLTALDVADSLPSC